MKIEKVNDHQIRCTLTKADLADRELKISELAYGTEKAKSLFRDMMQQASVKFGFEADDIPLMIEAIPLNADCIVLIITKVEDPEELDTRFSRFSPSSQEEDNGLDDLLSALPEHTDDMLDLVRRLHGSSKAGIGAEKEPAEEADGQEQQDEPAAQPAVSLASLTRIFHFSSLRNVIRAAHVAHGVAEASSSLYKAVDEKHYLLVLSADRSGALSFNKLCNILSEYGQLETAAGAGEAYLEEHMDPIVKEHALQDLAQI